MPAGTGDGLLSPGFVQLGPDSIPRIRFPPHCTGQASETLWPARIVLTRAIDAG
jgi:hypothetical protein